MSASGNVFLDAAARLVIAHRGDRVGRPENTLDALVHAVEIGADAVEFDVRVTRDAVPVLMHDPTLDRTTSGHGLLAEYTLADVRTLDAAARHDRHMVRARVPTLEEVLEHVRDIPLVIEVKEREAVDATEMLLKKFMVRDRALIGSADATIVERFRELGYVTCASMAEALRLVPRAIMGRMASASRYSVLSVTPRYGGIPIPVVRMAAAARRAGIPTQVWTVNDPVVATRFWNAGVSAIVTDDPSALLSARKR